MYVQIKVVDHFFICIFDPQKSENKAILGKYEHRGFSQNSP